MKQNGKMIYAQSSDIKSCTYLEYRKDMKKKSIAELEVLEWIEGKVKGMYPSRHVKVYKSGGDKFLWFLRQGGISRDPDFIAEVDDERMEIEFQYTGGDIQKDSIFDFKISKVGKKIKGETKRVPKNVLFLYLFQEAQIKFAFMDAKWILSNGKEGVAPAWGNREVYKISGRQLLTKVAQDPSLEQIWRFINAKLFLLDFQHELIDMNKEKLSHLLQGVVDEEKIVKIIPKNIESFFEVCFILDSFNKIPQNANLWLIYLLIYITPEILLEEISKIVYCVDFLYSKIQLKTNEIGSLVEKIKNLIEKVKSFEKKDGSYVSSIEVSPLEETRYAVFSINLLEDLIQDMIFYYSVSDLRPVKKIYENVKNVEKTFGFLKEIK